MSTRVVVTGAAGMIGSNIVHGLNAIGIDDVIAVDDLTDGPKYRNLLGAKSSTDLFLRVTRRGQVWFTETAGIWNRWVPKSNGRKKHITRYNRTTAVRAIRNIFKLQRLSPRRIRRIYYYNWFAPAEKKPRWDSGLIDSKGRERSTFRTFRAQVRKYAR